MYKKVLTLILMLHITEINSSSFRYNTRRLTSKITQILYEAKWNLFTPNSNEYIHLRNILELSNNVIDKNHQQLPIQITLATPLSEDFVSALVCLRGLAEKLQDCWTNHRSNDLQLLMTRVNELLELIYPHF